MSNDYDLADTTAAILFEKAEPRFNALLAKHSALHAEQFPDSVSREIFRCALVETAAADFPCADLEALSHGIQSFTHPASCAALEQMSLSKTSSDVFEPARGVDSAVVLAGLGLPWLPMIWRQCVFWRSRPRISILCLPYSHATKLRLWAITSVKRDLPFHDGLRSHSAAAGFP
jgi:hypothetical protein